MKKILSTLIFALILGYGNLIAETYRIYAVLVFSGSSTTPVLIQETTDAGNSWNGFNFKENYLRDEEGKEIKFNNFLPGLAYIESIGWTIPQKEEQILKNIANTVAGRSSFLLYKDVTEEEWLQWIENGKVKKK